MFNSFNFSLLKNLIERDISLRFKGSYLGFFWALLTPFFMLVMYTFIFSFIFKAKWNIEFDSKFSFSIILFSGLMVFNIFSDSISRASGLIVDNKNYVKKINFPLETLSYVVVANAIFNFLIAYTLLLIANIFVLKIMNISFVIAPLFLIPLVFLILGLVLIISSLSVYIRDLSNILSLLITITLFTSPIFYSLSMIPEQFVKFIYLNPLTYPISIFKNIIFLNTYPNLIEIVLYSIVSFIVFSLGFYIFNKLQPGFADEI